MFLRIEHLPEKKFVGKSIRMSLANNKTGELWKSFMPRRKEINNTIGNQLYSLQVYDPMHFTSFDVTREFTKWALVEVKNFDEVSPDLKTFTLAGGGYAVFLHRGSSQDNRTFQYIFSTWLPGSNYQLDDRPHFEVLGDKYKNNDPNSEEEIWIPVKSIQA